MYETPDCFAGTTFVIQPRFPGLSIIGGGLVVSAKYSADQGIDVFFIGMNT